MGKWTGTVSAVALLAAIGIWSTSTLVTKAAINEQAATAANSFPTTAAEFIREPDGVERKLMNAGKADRLVSIADCGKREWPFLALDCFAATPKPVQPAEPTVTVERRTGSNSSELVRSPASATPASVKMAAAASVAAPTMTAPSAMAAPSVTVAASAMVAAPACKQNLAAATARVERARAYTKGTPANGGADACAGYRRDFFEMVKAREVTAMCKTGAERDRDLGTIDLAVESINGAIAQSCGG
jgi:hypothetical protein